MAEGMESLEACTAIGEPQAKEIADVGRCTATELDHKSRGVACFRSKYVSYYRALRLDPDSRNPESSGCSLVSSSMCNKEMSG